MNYWKTKADGVLNTLLRQPDGVPCRVHTTPTQAKRLTSKIYVAAREKNMTVLVEKCHGNRELSLVVFRIFGLARRATRVRP